jgi:membrane protease YdiL (CAAX protease family)
MSNLLYKGWFRIILVIAGYCVTSVLFALIGDVIVESLFLDCTEYLQSLILQLLSFLGTLFLIMLFMHYLDKLPLGALGFRRKHYAKSIWSGILFGIILIAVCFVILLYTGEITIESFYFNGYYFFISLLIYFIGAFEEEILCRGYILRNLMLSFNKYVALLVSAVLFSLLHLLNPHYNWFTFLQLTLFGILLGISYIYTKNLWFPITLHFSWNFFQSTVFGFNVSGIETYTLIVQQRSEDNLLNGGAFGLEGSILCTIAVCITVIIMEAYFKNKKIK